MTQNNTLLKQEMEGKKPESKRDTKPTNRVTISSRRNAGFYVFVAKQALTNFETIELHALGLAMSVCVSAADTLVKYDFYCELLLGLDMQSSRILLQSPLK